MLRLQKNGTSELIVTASELVTLSNPYFLFEFMHEQSNKSVYCVLTDTSSSTSRFNSFSFTDGVDATFKYAGYYIYKIYQQDNGTNLNPALSDGLVEEGRMIVIQTDSPDYEYVQTINNEIYE